MPVNTRGDGRVCHKRGVGMPVNTCGVRECQKGGVGMPVNICGEEGGDNAIKAE